MSILLFTDASPENTSVHAAFQLWKTAHDQLMNAIDVYASACTAFESACSRGRLSFYEDNNDFDAALLTVEIELPRLENQARILANSIPNLKKARNQSYTLVPINVLPQSLLLSIFSMLVDSEHTNQTHLHSDQIRPHPALAISCVSSAWRTLTFGSPILWSSIFFHPGDQDDLATQLALVRAGNALLDIQASFPWERNFDWLRLLHPRSDQIRSLELVLPDMDLLRAIMAIWPRESLAPSLKTMTMKIVKTIYAIDTAPPKVLPEWAHELLFQNVTSLSLYGGYFDWDSAAFKGLEHLQLVGLGSRPSPTFGQIVSILRSSPGLRTLGLGNMRLQPDECVEDVPIYFKYLHKLSLMSLVEPDLSKLLPLISPGPQPLTMHMNYELILGPATDAYVEFFRRSTIESIYFHTRISRITMSDVFSSLPHIRFLYLSRNRYLSNILHALAAPQPTPTEAMEVTDEATPETQPPKPAVPCPLLHTIHMHDCKFKVTEDMLGQPVTDQPELTVKLQLCDPPDLVDIFLQRFVGLVSGQVFLESLAGSEPPSDVPFYGLNRTNTFTLNKRAQVENTGTAMLDDI